MAGRKIDETNVDAFIEELKSRTKGQYIHQGVAFNKDCKRQMELLRKALLDSSSFSGLIKELLAVRFYVKGEENNYQQTFNQHQEFPLKHPESRDFGNWI